MTGICSSRRRPIHSGIAGARCNFEFRKSGSKRNIVRRNRSGDAAAQACGEHEVGYGTGKPTSPRGVPANSSGSRLPNHADASTSPSITWCASATNP